MNHTVATIAGIQGWSGWAYVAYIIDAYACGILGWRCSTSMTTPLVLEVIEQAMTSHGRPSEV